MIKGSTIIMSDEFISELTRHKDICKKKLDIEMMPEAREELTRRYELLEEKLNQALEFQDVIDEVVNLDMPRLTAVKTINGLVLPIKNVQIL